VLERVQTIPRPLEDAFAFFADPSNLEAITPPWLAFGIDQAPERLERGATLRYRLRLFGVPLRWRTLISNWRPPHAFADVQVQGPFAAWEHEHELTEVAGGTAVRDRVRYRVPGGPLAPLVQWVVGRWVAEIFDYRAERMRELLH
jgi:ligand-binding SRPBCC domain-containing protein